jgi:hypothetical protein
MQKGGFLFALLRSRRCETAEKPATANGRKETRIFHCGKNAKNPQNGHSQRCF